MRLDSYSEKLVESYLRKLSHSRSRTEMKEIRSQVHEWLVWLLQKEEISQSLFSSLHRRFGLDDKVDLKQSENLPFYFRRGILFISFSICTALVLFSIFYFFTQYRRENPAVSISSPMISGRTIPFRGVLTDAEGVPIDTKQDVFFALYHTKEGGDQLYSGSCAGQNGLTPEYNGAFTIVLGSSCDMTPIPETLLNSQQSLYLGVTVGTGDEIVPRYKISTSGYSLDSAALGGLPVGSTENTVPYIDADGVLKLDSETASVRSSTGAFIIEGKDVVLQTQEQSPGNILFQPGIGGNSSFTSGNVGIGIITPEKRLSVVGVEPYTSIASIKNLATTEERDASVLDLGLGVDSKGISPTFVNFYAEATKEENGQLVGAIRLNNNRVVYETSGADFAEYFPTDDSDQLVPGMIVTIGESGIHVGQQKESIIGVVTDTAGYVGNAQTTSESMVLVGLIGQINTYITDENGSITAGSLISLGSIPGYGVVGVRNEPTIGIALISSKNLSIPLSNKACPEPYRSRSSVSGRLIQCGKLPLLVRPQ